MEINEALALSDSQFPLVKVHPSVVMSILDLYSRRADKNGRVIGTLLGVVREDCIEVTDCFGLPHTESFVDGKAAVLLDQLTAQSRLTLHHRVHRQEAAIGWFSSTTANGALLTDFCPLIHEHYSTNHCSDPLHLVVDTTLSGEFIVPRAFVSRPMVLQENIVGNVFYEVGAEFDFSEAERLVFPHLLGRGGEDGRTVQESELLSEQKRINGSLQRLAAALDDVQKYVDDVVAGNCVGNAKFGVELSEAVSVLQALDRQDLLTTITEKNQDMAMLSYLTALIQCQIAVAEKIHSVM